MNLDIYGGVKGVMNYTRTSQDTSMIVHLEPPPSCTVAPTLECTGIIHYTLCPILYVCNYVERLQWQREPER